MRLSSMVIVVALGLVSGCCERGLSEAVEIAIEPHGPLRAIATDQGFAGLYYLVDGGGYVSILDTVKTRRRYELAVVEQVQVSSYPLVDVTVADDDSVWIVDEAGVVFDSTDEGRNWVSHPLDAGLAPRGILVRSGEYVVVYGDDFVRVRPLAGGDWQAPDAPVGGWGLLRVDTPGPRMMLLSDGDNLLIADDPLGIWQRIEAPTEVLALGPGSGFDSYIVGGRDGTLMEATVEETESWTEAAWVPVYEGIDEDVVAIEGRWLLTAAGEIVNLREDDFPEPGDARAGLAGDSYEVVVFGADGPVLTSHWNECVYY